jgi:hypothetical protein
MQEDGLDRKNPSREETIGVGPVPGSRIRSGSWYGNPLQTGASATAGGPLPRREALGIHGWRG